MIDEQWWELGHCRTANPAIFDGRHASANTDWSAAKRMCASCPVQPQCLDYVLSLPREYHADRSFAAGYTPEELDEIKKRRRK